MTLPSQLRPFFEVIEPNARGYRPDIDGLRAIAVIAVIAYHYAPRKFPGGFIGVDIFFVLSGYLITGILAKHFETRSFGRELLVFYQHRIRRIFPALSLVLFFCLIVGWLTFFALEYAALGKHIAAGAGFVQNIALWQEAGYFDAAAIQKPLLHLWSLAVEEQFYIFWPFVLWLMMRSNWPLLTGIAIIASLSFILNVWEIANERSAAAFYLPLTRAWELMAGAWLAIGHKTQASWLSRWPTSQAWLGLILIALGFSFIRPDEYFPGFWALLPVTGTALVINAGAQTLPNRRILSLRPAVWIGLISYPLYLWHWTLLSLTVILLSDNTEHGMLRIYKAIALILSVALAYLTYRWLEQPIRRRGGNTATALLISFVLILGLSGLVIFVLQGLPNRSPTLVSPKAENYLASIKATNLQQECFERLQGAALAERWSCTLGDINAQTWIAAYGDSHALSLLPALDEYGKQHSVRVVFAGLSGCPPLLHTRPHRPSGDACLALSTQITQLAKNQSAAAIVLIARWTYYSGGTTRPQESQPISTPQQDKVPDALTGLSALTHGLEETLRYYSDLGIPVLVVEDNPQQATSLPMNVIRFAKNLSDAEINTQAVTFKEHQRNQQAVNLVIGRLAAAYPLVSTLNMDSALCNSAICPWVKGGKFLYFDDDHLSVAGSQFIYPLLERTLNRTIRASERR